MQYRNYINLYFLYHKELFLKEKRCVFAQDATKTACLFVNGVQFEACKYGYPHPCICRGALHLFSYASRIFLVGLYGMLVSRARYRKKAVRRALHKTNAILLRYAVSDKTLHKETWYPGKSALNATALSMVLFESA